MIITLYTEEFFDASHILENYEGKCARLHGHAWKVGVWVKGEEEEKSSSGILWDFHNLKNIVAFLDHSHLNDKLGCNPTVENITGYIYHTIKKESPHLSVKVRVYENALSKESYCETGDF
ncbi:MAG: 6-carboxytetrahydropterin synthase [Spirochaetales bacterium]|nr:6-carboxytetrahydropterin synthase [Spirochaetales bacterium]